MNSIQSTKKGQAMVEFAIIIPIIVLLNKKEVMGENKPGFWLNSGLWLTLIFSLITAYFGLEGLIKKFLA